MQTADDLVLFTRQFMGAGAMTSHNHSEGKKAGNWLPISKGLGTRSDVLINRSCGFHGDRLLAVCLSRSGHSMSISCYFCHFVFM